MYGPLQVTLLCMVPFRSRYYIWLLQVTLVCMPHSSSGHVIMYGPLQLTLLYNIWPTSGDVTMYGLFQVTLICLAYFRSPCRETYFYVYHVARVCVTRCISCRPGGCYSMYVMSSRCVLSNVRHVIQVCTAPCMLCRPGVYFPHVRLVVQVFITPMHAMLSRCLLLCVRHIGRVCITRCTSCCPGVYYPMYTIAVRCVLPRCYTS